MTASAAQSPTLQCGRFVLPLDRPLIMGVVNLTPDSFSDGGQWIDPVRAIEHAQSLIQQGADLIDLGAESTRPGAAEVPVAQEIDRLEPVLRGLAAAGVPLSVDTRKPAVMRAAIALGAVLINDVEGFRTDAAIDAVSGSDVGLCVMHMPGNPQTMQELATYTDVVGDVREFLAHRVRALQDAGVDRRRIVLDPGIGFGKTLQHNLTLLARLPDLGVEGLPMMVGISRKSMIGQLTGRAVDERLPGSLAALLSAVVRGASIVRVHDVAATRDALTVWRAVESAGVAAA